MSERLDSPVLDERRYKIRYIQSGEKQAEAAKSLKQIVGPVGFEPTTNGL